MTDNEQFSAQEAAYKECLDLAAANGWWATHTAISEDDPHGGVDWTEMVKTFRADSKI